MKVLSVRPFGVNFQSAPTTNDTQQNKPVKSASVTNSIQPSSDAVRAYILGGANLKKESAAIQAQETQKSAVQTEDSQVDKISAQDILAHSKEIKAKSAQILSFADSFKDQVKSKAQDVQKNISEVSAIIIQGQSNDFNTIQNENSTISFEKQENSSLIIKEVDNNGETKRRTIAIPKENGYMPATIEEFGTSTNRIELENGNYMAYFDCSKKENHGSAKEALGFDAKKSTYSYAIDVEDMYASNLSNAEEIYALDKDFELEEYFKDISFEEDGLEYEENIVFFNSKLISYAKEGQIANDGRETSEEFFSFDKDNSSLNAYVECDFDKSPTKKVYEFDESGQVVNYSEK